MDKQHQLSMADIQRERNREAVRKCRARKKEMEQTLQMKLSQLETENAKLRTRLELGNTEAKDAKDSHAEQLIQIMKSYLYQLNELDLRNGVVHSQVHGHGVGASGGASSSTTDLENKLQQVVDEYVQRHEDHGRDKQTSLGFIMGRLHANAKSSGLSRIYLSLIGNHQDDQFYAPNVESPWNDFVKALQLTQDQQNKLKRRRLQAGRVIAELRYAERKVDALHKMIRSIRTSADMMTTLPNVISTRQFAKFIAWVNTEPGCKDILDLLFQIMIRQFDDEIAAERKQNQERDTSAQEVDRLLFEVRSASGATVKRLFETLREDEMQELVRCHFHPNITVVDPSNGGEWCGHQGLIKYVRMVQKAFSVGEDNATTRSFALIDKSITIDGPTVRGTFELFGTYSGRLSEAAQGRMGKDADPSIKKESSSLPTPAASNAISKSESASSTASTSSTSSTASSSSSTPRKVISCEVVVSISFAEASDRIVELVISMDTLSFMTQLGLILGVNPILSVLNDSSNGTSIHSAAGPRVLQSLKRKRDAMEADSISAPPSNGNTPRPQGSEPTSFPFSVLDMPQLIMIDSNMNEYKALRSRCHARIKDMFEADNQVMLKETAEKVLHPTCTFTDSNMAEKSTGIDECIKYVNRIKRVFSKIKVVKSTMTDAVPAASSSNAKAAGSGAADTQAEEPAATIPRSASNSPVANVFDLSRTSEDQRLAVRWVIDSMYTGAYLPEPRQCTLNVDLFIEFDYVFVDEPSTSTPPSSSTPVAQGEATARRELKISKVQFSWDASNVMAQLGS